MSRDTIETSDTGTRGAPRHWAPCAALSILVTVGAAGWAGASSDLQCYVIKDPQAAEKYSVDVDGLQLEPGCTLVSRAKMLCSRGTHANVLPAPPGDLPPEEPGPSFLCYKVKCPKVEPPAPTVGEDAYGLRYITVKKSKLACVPIDGGSEPTRCCNVVFSTQPIGCYDFVTGVNSVGEMLCGGSFFSEATLGAEGEVCGGVSGVCGAEFVSTGSCCETTSAGYPFCFEGPDATVAPLCASIGTVVPGARCGIAGGCSLP